MTAVVLSHAEPRWAVGGYFGVDVFFVLSGYLITTILLREWAATGRVDLVRFWARRARRLLPALVFVLTAVGIGAAVAPSVLGSPGLIGDTLATVGYVANWHFIAVHASYFAASNNPSPLLHTWSLAIEEQFYLIWPPVLAAIIGAAARPRSRRDDPERAHRRRLATASLAAALGAVASAAWMAVLAPSRSVAVDRAYYGSDSRAQGLLVGAALAGMCLWWGPIRSDRGRRAMTAAGLAGAAGVVAMVRLVPENSAITFRGGFAVLALCVAAVIASVTNTPTQPLARLLSTRPLPYLGRISYGVYLFYWPVLLVLTAGRTGLHGVALLLARSSVIVALAAISFHLVETPVRQAFAAGWRGLAAVPAAAAVVFVLPLVVPPAGATGTAASAAPSLGTAPAGLPTGDTMPGDTMPRSTMSAGPVRILLVGDSLAGSLGVGLSSVAWRYGAEVVNRGAPGCSLAEGSRVRLLWYTIAPGNPCRPDDPGSLLATYRSLVARFDPDVVVYLARSDTLDTELGGTWGHIGQPPMDRWAESRFQAAVSALGSGGARVVLLTSPLYDSGEQGDGRPWPENAPARVTTDNRLLSEAARDLPARASVFDLGSMLSPEGRFATVLDGVPVRCTDGVHLSVAGGQWIAARLLPPLVSLGRTHSTGAPASARSALAPEPPPGWYSKLPCGAPTG